MDPMLHMLRRDAVEDFDAECVISRPDDEADPVWDGSEYVTPDMTVYSGGCSLLTDAKTHQEVQAGSRTHTVRGYGLDVPHDVAARIGDKVKITSSPDGLAVDVGLRVVDVPKSDWTTVRRLVVEETV